MRLELKSVLGQSLDTDGSFFQLFRAAHHLENIAARWAPGVLGKPFPSVLCSNLQYRVSITSQSRIQPSFLPTDDRQDMSKAQ